MNNKKLSKVISYALRHNPSRYNLELDGEGWTSIENLLENLCQRRKEWKNLTQANLELMIEKSEKKRHEISGDRIRCLYGHSLKSKIIKEPITPPDILYHGTARETAILIMKTGLLPMNRQYVHLSQDLETAIMVGSRKDSQPIVLKVDAKGANSKKINFYHGNEKIWLADQVPPEFISKVEK